MVEETTTTNDSLTLDEREAITAQLEAEIKAKREKDQTIINLQAEINRLTQEKDLLTQALSQSVMKYRELIISQHPYLADFIQGNSIEEIDASLAKAKALMEKVRTALETEIKQAQVPAGAPVRLNLIPEGLSPREKIVYGISQKR